MHTTSKRWSLWRDIRVRTRQHLPSAVFLWMARIFLFRLFLLYSTRYVLGCICSPGGLMRMKKTRSQSSTWEGAWTNSNVMVHSLVSRSVVYFPYDTWAWYNVPACCIECACAHMLEWKYVMVREMTPHMPDRVVTPSSNKCVCLWTCHHYISNAIVSREYMLLEVCGHVMYGACMT